MARGVAGEDAIGGAPVATMRIAETAEVHGPDPIDNSIRGVVGVTSEDQVSPASCEHASRPRERCFNFDEPFEQVRITSDVARVRKRTLTIDDVSLSVAADHPDVRQAFQSF